MINEFVVHLDMDLKRVFNQRKYQYKLNAFNAIYCQLLPTCITYMNLSPCYYIKVFNTVYIYQNTLDTIKNSIKLT